jgi:hypothetical protein
LNVRLNSPGDNMSFGATDDAFASGFTENTLSRLERRRAVASLPTLRPAYALAVLALASCGKLDAAGLYLSKTDRQIALAPLTESAGGAVSRRWKTCSWP